MGRPLISSSPLRSVQLWSVGLLALLVGPLRSSLSWSIDTGRSLGWSVYQPKLQYGRPPWRVVDLIIQSKKEVDPTSVGRTLSVDSCWELVPPTDGANWWRSPSIVSDWSIDWSIDTNQSVGLEALDIWSYAPLLFIKEVGLLGICVWNEGFPHYL